MYRGEHGTFVPGIKQAVSTTGELRPSCCSVQLKPAESRFVNSEQNQQRPFLKLNSCFEIFSFDLLLLLDKRCLEKTIVPLTFQ